MLMIQAYREDVPSVQNLSIWSGYGERLDLILQETKLLGIIRGLPRRRVYFVEIKEMSLDRAIEK